MSWSGFQQIDGNKTDIVFQQFAVAGLIVSGKGTDASGKFKISGNVIGMKIKFDQVLADKKKISYSGVMNAEKTEIKGSAKIG